MFVLAMVLYIGCLAYLPKIIMMKKFLPAYSALTFPLAISGIATNSMYLYFKNGGNDMPILQYLAWFQTAMCVIFVLYVLVRYVHHFFVKPLAVMKQKEAVPEP